MVVEGPGLRLVARVQRGGVNGCGEAGSPTPQPRTSPFPHPKKKKKSVKERRSESVEMAKLYTPLENQESMFKKRHQKLKRKKKKSGEKCKISLHFSGFKNKDSTTPTLLAGNLRSLVPPLLKT